MKTGKPIIGLAGGIGSGKSTVAAILGELGAAVIDSDRLNHEELGSPEVLGCLRQWWGPRVVKPDGRPDRDAIREIVASDRDQRERLEQLVHPRIAGRSQSLKTQYQADPDIRAVVWDAPLLYEVGLDEQCDCVVFVETDRQVRLKRVAERSGWTPEDLDRFEKTQTPLDVKRRNADYIVSGNSTVDDLRRQVEEVFSQILTGS